MIENSELVRVEATDRSLLGERHRRTQLTDDRRSRVCGGAEDLASVFASPPSHQPPALQPVHEPGNAGRPLQQPFGNLKRRKAFRSGIGQDPEDVVLLERDVMHGEVAFDSTLDLVRHREQGPDGGLVAR